MSTKLLTIKEAARVMHISPQTIYAWIAKGKIGAVNLNEDNRRALWRIPLSEVEDKIGLPVCPETLEPIISPAICATCKRDCPRAGHVGKKEE